MKSMVLNNSDVELIAQLPVCREMNGEEKKIFIRHLSGFEYEREEAIFEQYKHDNDHLFIVLDGAVEITTQSDNSEYKQFAVTSLQGGDIAGIFSFIDGRRHQASAKSKTRVRVAVISRKDYEHFHEYHPEIADIVMEYLKSNLRERIEFIQPLLIEA